MKKTALVLSIIVTLASCGGATQEDCVDCATDSAVVVDSTVVVDTTAVATDSVEVK